VLVQQNSRTAWSIRQPVHALPTPGPGNPAGTASLVICSRSPTELEQQNRCFRVAINPADPRPPYRQVADRLRAAINGGELQPGAMLPSVRALAAEYGVSNPTASRALETLKSQGLIDTQPGREKGRRAKRPGPHVSLNPTL